MPITFLFGDKDELSDLLKQKEFIYQVNAPTNVQFVKGYDHFSFCGREKDQALQAKILAALKGVTESDMIWLKYVEMRRVQEMIRLEEEAAKEDSLWNRMFGL